MNWLCLVDILKNIANGIKVAGDIIALAVGEGGMGQLLQVLLAKRQSCTGLQLLPDPVAIKG